MEITSNHKKITITSTPEQGYLFVHQVIFKGDDSDQIKQTNSISEFDLNLDGYYVVKEFKLEESNIDIFDLNDLAPINEVNILVLCDIEDCLNKSNHQLLELAIRLKCPSDNLKYIEIKNQRDLLFVSYSALKYLGELNHFDQAQTLINYLTPCNCLCD